MAWSAWVVVALLLADVPDNAYNMNIYFFSNSFYLLKCISLYFCAILIVFYADSDLHSLNYFS